MALYRGAASKASVPSAGCIYRRRKISRPRSFEKAPFAESQRRTSEITNLAYFARPLARLRFISENWAVDVSLFKRISICRLLLYGRRNELSELRDAILTAVYKPIRSPI